jgi:hypothetical protein
MKQTLLLTAFDRLVNFRLAWSDSALIHLAHAAKTQTGP